MHLEHGEERKQLCKLKSCVSYETRLDREKNLYSRILQIYHVETRKCITFQGIIKIDTDSYFCAE